MNTFTRVAAIVGGGAFGGIFVWGFLIQFLFRLRGHSDAARLELYTKIGVFALFCVFGYCCVPILLRAFVWGQERIGNGQLGPIQVMRTHFSAMVFGFWGVFTAGLLVALPVMAKDFFNFAESVGSSSGTLRADIDMPLDEVRRGSTFAIGSAHGPGITGAYDLIGKGIFDFEIPGSGLRFEKSRYFFVEGYPHGDQRVRTLHVGISPVKLGLDASNAWSRMIESQFEAKGWKVGYFVYRTREQQILHGRITSERDPHYWSDGRRIVHLERSRVDEAKPGDNAETDGYYVIAIHLSSLRESSARNLQFSPPDESIPKLD